MSMTTRPRSALRAGGRLAAILGAGVLALAALSATALAQGFQDAQRFAVVVGNSNYETLPLENPINDARAIAGVLRELDFDVHLVEDTDLETLDALMDGLDTLYGPDSVGLFYYAGHAIQHRGENYLLPTDFQAPDFETLRDTSIAVSRIIDGFEAADVGLKIVILDACRDFPFGAAQEAMGGGLADIDAEGEILFSYATRAGEIADDGVGPNSPFTGALVSALELPGKDIYDVFKTVRSKVRQATSGRQIPWLGGSIESDFIFRAVERRPAPPPQQVSSFDIVDVHWRTIEISDDPTDFLRFAETHPRTPLAEVALQRAQLLQAQDQTEIPAPNAPTQTLPDGRILVTRCDSWASDPLDPRRISPGIEWGLLNSRQAIRDCAAAVAADPDNPRLNFLFARALDVAERFEEARDFYERAAGAEYGAALRNLGFMFRTGRGVERDEALAARYYLAAALLGVLDARKNISWMYEEGRGVEQSTDETLRWLNLAAEDGFPRALDHLGNIYRKGELVEQDIDRAMEFYRRGAAQNFGNAVANVARAYRDGLGEEKDLAEAARLYQRATDLGNAFAPYHLGRMLLQGGDGITRDPERARALLELSAERGFEWALWALARGYERGEFDAPADPENALYYMILAEAAGRMVQTKGGEQLADEAAAKRDELAAQTDAAVTAAAERRAALWLEQNSLFDFTIIYQR